MDERRLSVLVSPGFLAALCLLLLNDFALKPLFHNWLTGKLSDFAGLFVFPLFWSVVFPRRRRAVYLLVAAAFVFWKSPLSRPVLDAWNGLALLPLERTVDASDLLALAVLPLSFAYGRRAPLQRASPRLVPYLVASVSLFAFAATSFRTEFPYDNRYVFPETRAELTRRAYHLSHLDGRYRLSGCSAAQVTPGQIEVTIPTDFCFDRVNATVAIEDDGVGSVLSLKRMQHECPEGDDDKRRMLSIFEKQFVEKLGAAGTGPPHGGTAAPFSPTPRSELRRRGRLYFVAVGDVPGVDFEALANHFGRKYDLPARVLPQLPLSDEVRTTGLPHSRPLAAGMIAYVARKYPRAAEDPESVVIVISEGMTVEQVGDRVYNLSLDLEGRFAVVATEALTPSNFCEPDDRALVEARLRKVVARNIGALYFRLPRSDDPRSVLYTGLGCVDELDNQGEDF